MDIKRTIVEQIYELLRKKIVDLEVAPGTRLNIMDLADQFKVSQTPIKEALKELSKNGLVVTEARKGYFTIQLTPKDVKEVFQLRLLFESCAIRTGNFDLSKIGELKKEMESLQKEPDKKRNKHMFLELDKRLHCLLIQSSDNRRMQNFFFRIYDLVVMSLSFVKRLYDSTEEHIEMLNAIQNGDPEKACKILEVHLRDSQDIILRELEDLQTRQKKG